MHRLEVVEAAEEKVEEVTEAVEEKVEEAELKDSILNKKLDFDAKFETKTIEDEFFNEPSLEDLTTNMVSFFKANNICIACIGNIWIRRYYFTQMPFRR